MTNKKMNDKRKSSRRTVIAHVGRAARKLHQELDAEADEEDLQNNVFQSNSEHREKIMGALALMELALKLALKSPLTQMKTTKTPNKPNHRFGPKCDLKLMAFLNIHF